MKLFIALAALLISHAASSQPLADPWDRMERAAPEKAGWSFRDTFGLPERMCYALKPGKSWPAGDWGQPEVRAQATKNGAIKFKPRADGKCHADDAVK